MQGRGGEAAHRTAAPIDDGDGNAALAAEGQGIGADENSFGSYKEMVEMENGNLALFGCFKLG